MKTKKVVIDRTKWLRGKGPSNSYLWDSQSGRGCCLGHVLNKAHGKSYKSMNRFRSPATYAVRINKKNPLCILNPLHKSYEHSEDIRRAMRINDSSFRSDEHREKELKELMLPLGYELVFIN